MDYIANSALWSGGLSHRGGGAQGPGIKTALGKLRPCRGICWSSSWQLVWTSSINIHFLWNNLPCWNHSGNTLGLSRYLWYNSAFSRCLKLWCTCLCFHSQKAIALLGLCQDLFFQRKQGKKVQIPYWNWNAMQPSGQIKSPHLTKWFHNMGSALIFEKCEARQNNLDPISDFLHSLSTFYPNNEDFSASLILQKPSLVVLAGGSMIGTE